VIDYKYWQIAAHQQKPRTDLKFKHGRRRRVSLFPLGEGTTAWMQEAEQRREQLPRMVLLIPTESSFPRKACPGML
jgi:hypothetical protein